MDSSAHPTLLNIRCPEPADGCRQITYQLFGLGITSDLALPELPVCPSATACISVCALTDDRLVAPASGRAGAVWAFAASERGLWFCREGVGEFLIGPQGETVCYRRGAGVGDATLRGMLIDQVLPRVIAHRGQLVLHAGLVAFGERALCLLGPSGVGKSSLSVAGHASGLRLLGDDSVRVDLATGAIHCVPAYIGARLYQDSVTALAGALRFDAPASTLAPKQRYRPAGPQMLAPYHLAAIAHLERQGDGAADCDPARAPLAAISLLRLPPTEAAALLTAQSFVLDPTDRGRIQGLLRQTAEVAARVPVYRLRYPSGYEHLPAVCARLVELLQDG